MSLYLFNPWWSMYGIFAYIWLIFMVNVGKYTIHGSSGNRRHQHGITRHPEDFHEVADVTTPTALTSPEVGFWLVLFDKNWGNSAANKKDCSPKTWTNSDYRLVDPLPSRHDFSCGVSKALGPTCNFWIHLRSRLRSLKRWKSWRLLNMRRWHLGWLLKRKITGVATTGVGGIFVPEEGGWEMFCFAFWLGGGGKWHYDWLKGMMKPWNIMKWECCFERISDGFFCVRCESQWSSQIWVSCLGSRDAADWMVLLLIRRITYTLYNHLGRGLKGFDLHLGILTWIPKNDALPNVFPFRYAYVWVCILFFLGGTIWFLTCVEQTTT